MGKPAAFVVNFNGAKGKLTAMVVSPSGSQEEALVQEVDDGQYAVRFIPRENGLHLVHVLFDGYHIPDSPFRYEKKHILNRYMSGEVSQGVVSWTCDPVLALGQRFDSHFRCQFFCNPLGLGNLQFTIYNLFTNGK